MTVRSVVLKVAAAFGTGAVCLTGPAAVGAVASPDACALLTQAEVGAALGVGVDPGQRLIPNDTRFCTWSEHGKSQIGRNVQVTVITERQYQLNKTPTPSTTKTPASGVGNEAYFSKARSSVFSLSVKKGGTYFRVMARSNPDALVKGNNAASDQRDQEVDLTLARAIVKRL